MRGPEGHLTKLTGKLWARTLFFFYQIINTKCIAPFTKFWRPPSCRLPGLSWRCRPTLWRRVFCSSPRLFRRDTKLHCRLSGLGTVSQLHRDPKFTTVHRDWQKTRHRDTDVNSPNRRAVRLCKNSNVLFIT